jgi:BlaI family transcriptional regulator, penicillinase repressor
MLLSRSRRQAPSPLEQIVLNYLWEHPDSTAEACREGLAPERRLKDSTIRTVLRSLEHKGFVTHVLDGRTFIYRAVDSRRDVAVEAAKQLIDRFCRGSIEELLVGLIDKQMLQPAQLERLAKKIAERKEKNK